MKVAYILYNERPMSGLLRGQVIEMLCELVRGQKNLELTVICFWQPFLLVTAKKDIEEMVSLLASADISVENYYICPPNRLFSSNKYLFKILSSLCVPIFRRIIGTRFSVVHSRAYYASFFASKIRTEMDFKLIFDMRSLFPDEMLASGKVAIDSRQYRLWKGIEQTILESSDHSIVVSKAMGDAVRKICPSSKVEHIPLCVDTKTHVGSLQARAEIRKGFEVSQSRIIAYCGSLTLDFNNDINEYARYISAIYSEFNDTHFMIITQTTSLRVKEIICSEGISEKNVTVVQAQGNKLFEILSCCDAGIFVMKPGADRDTRLGVKFVEYLAAGLPVIANVNVGAAAEIIKDTGLGVVLDLDTDTNIRSTIENMFADEPRMRERCRDFAVSNFDTKTVASRYSSLYRKDCVN